MYLAVPGCTWSGMIGSGLVGSGLAWPGLVWPGLVWPVLKGLKMFGTIKPKCQWIGLDGWMGYLQTGPFLDHLTVITNEWKRIF